MKIWMLIWSYWPGPQGGAERQCRLVCPYLARRNVSCTVITARLAYGSKRIERDDETTIRRVGLLIPLLNGLKDLMGRMIRIPAFFQIRQLSDRKMTDGQAATNGRLKVAFWLELPFVWLARLNFIVELVCWSYANRRSVDVIHAHEAGWLGALAQLIGRICDIPVVCKAATSPAFPRIGWDVPFRLLLNRSQRRSDIIVLNETAQTDLALEGFPIGKSTVIANAVLMPSRPAVPEKSDTVLYVGNFSQGAHLKAFDVLFKAWALVHRDNTAARLVVAGGGNLTMWQDFVRELDCAVSVEFLGFVDNPGKLYEHAGLFVLPSRVEGMSNALLEALSFGLPVVASDIPANRAVVNASGSALLVEVGNERALADAILSLLADPARRAEMGRLGRELVQQRHDVEQISNRLLSLYQRKTAGATGCRR
jgi:glycosyltransferase involved in cell wall biosynthesis